MNTQRISQWIPEHNFYRLKMDHFPLTIVACSCSITWNGFPGLHRKRESILRSFGVSRSSNLGSCCLAPWLICLYWQHKSFTVFMPVSHCGLFCLVLSALPGVPDPLPTFYSIWDIQWHSKTPFKSFWRGLGISKAPIFIYWSPIFWDKGSRQFSQRGWLGLQDGTLMHGVSAMVGVWFHHVLYSQETAAYASPMKLPSNAESAAMLILDFTASRAWKNKYCQVFLF